MVINLHKKAALSKCAISDIYNARMLVVTPYKCSPEQISLTEILVLFVLYNEILFIIS